MTTAWRFDRMATVCDPGSGRVTASFAGVAKHYGRGGDLPAAAREPQGRGGEGQPHRRATLVAHPGRRCHRRAGPGRLDRFCRARGDTRMRATADGKSTVAAVAATEPLHPVAAAPYPVIVAEQRTASRQALVAYRGNRYSVPPELAMATVTRDPPGRWPVHRHRHRTGIVIARHAARRRAGATVRDTGHVTALDAAAMAAASTGRPHRRKQRIPPGPRPAPPRPNSASVSPLATTLSSNHQTPHPIPPSSTWPPTSRRPAEEHPAMTTTNTSLTQPATAEAASRYQQLRGHLAALKLHAAAEALPAVLDQAATEQLSLTAALERLLAIEVDATEARRLAGRLRFACLPTPATLEDFDFDAAAGVDRTLIDELATCRYLESATNMLLDRPARVGKTHLAVGPGPGRRPRRLPHLLHHRRRPRRPLPPRRDRRPLGHHHAVLRRTDPAGHR